MGKSANRKKTKGTSQGTAKKGRTKRPNPLPEGMTQARYDKLVAEAEAPFKGLRKFAYASFGASGAIGGFVFLTKILAGRDLAQSVPNLALQIGVVALMVFLYRWEDRNKEDK
ncbi:MAG: DUF3493 domain-containing protein [Phormidesmis sp.]